MLDREIEAYPIDEESYLLGTATTTSTRDDNDESHPPNSVPGPLHRWKSYLFSTPSSASLPLYHQHRNKSTIDQSKMMPAYSETNDTLESNSNNNNNAKSDQIATFPPLNPDRSDSLLEQQESQQQQQYQSKRRKRSLAGKVKASVTKPAKAVGRRVFRNRYSSKVEVLGGREEVRLSRDIGNKTPEDFFRTDSLDRDAELNGGTRRQSSGLRRSLNRIMSQRRSSQTTSGGDQRSDLGAPSFATYHETDDDAVDWPVRSVEAITRNAVILCAVYVMGATHPRWSPNVLKALEFLVTAWATCLVILVLGWVRNPSRSEQHQQHRHCEPRYTDYQQLLNQQQREGDPTEEYSSESTPLVEHPVREETKAYGTSAAVSTTTNSDFARRTSNQSDEKQPLVIKTVSHAEVEDTEGDFVEKESSFEDPDVSSKKKPHDQENQQGVEHPKLATFFVIDTNTGERINCNTPKPYRISNEWMEMDVLAMMRTPDVDDPSAPKGTATNDKISEHFQGKARCFEFQYQVRLKKAPVGKRVYFSCELDDEVKIGIVTKAFVSAAMAFVKKTNQSFHYNITGSKKKTSDGKYENPHMSFTAEASLDRFVVTKQGETPPQLGTHIYEHPDSIKKRKSSGNLVDWNTEDTYTFAIWSSYANFLDWTIQNLPGIKPFGLASVLGPQSINLTLYLIDANLEGDNHYRKDITELIKLELSNSKVSNIGKEAKKWMLTHDAKAASKKQACSVPPSPGVNIKWSRQRFSSEDSIPPLPLCDSREGEEGNRSPLAMNDTMDEMDYVDEDTANAAELGEGIYLRSGDSVLLREFLCEDEKSTACGLVNGGGFAVLSKRNVPIVIEKTKRSKTNKLIKSGDTVMFKLIQNKAGTDEIETRYLTIHRGWWLKWVTTMPSKNGYFTIFTHETELGEKALPTDETQSSFLTLGGSFSLRHKRWSKYSVGVSSEPSTNFGGRMLSLYNRNSKRTSNNKAAAEMEAYQSEDEGDFEKDMPSVGGSGWIKPLVLCTQDPLGLVINSPKSPSQLSRFDDTGQEKVEPQTPGGSKLLFSCDHARADVPAWIEMLDREQRVRQLAYVVRIVNRTTSGDNKLAATNGYETFTRLKSGKDLARIMNIGQSIKIPTVAPKTVRSGRSSDSTDIDASGVGDANAMVKSYSSPTLSSETISGTNLSGDGVDEMMTSKKSSSSELEEYDLYENPGMDIDEGDVMSPTKHDYDNSMNSVASMASICSMEDGSLISDSSASDNESASKQKKKKRLRKLKKLGKKTVVGTGRITKKTGKVVATTGKKLKPVVTLKANKQPRKEPKKKNSYSQSSVDKKMKKLGKIEAKSGGPPIFLAGELCATEQSRRTASRVLERMSGVHTQSSAWQRCNNALSSELGFMTEQDAWFLDGDAMHLGIKPNKKHGKLLGESVVARCLWESHWREEWCGMYESTLSFHAPLARSTCHEISYSEIKLVRKLDADSLCPLPGFAVLVIETAWQCHYMAFHDEPSLDDFAEKVDNAIEGYNATQQTDDLEKNELRKARFWQGFQTLSETSLASGASKWAKVLSNQKAKERAILNGRRMAFDSSTMSFGGSVRKAYVFVERLLTTALTFSFTTLEQDPGSFIDFLDMTSELRFLPLREMDFSSPYALCMFVNIYHCLLQQALLLSVNGPLHKKSISHFMRTSCYEIGGDVFSLAELHSCVICGKMSKLINPKPPYVDAPKKSNAYKYYALNYTDSRVHFVLNTADMACPVSVPVLSQKYLEQQLNAACVDFLCSNRQLLVDTKRKIVTLPKICEIRRNDFGTSELFAILKIVADEMNDNDLGRAIKEVIEKGEKGLTIKFKHTQEQYHSSLRLLTAATMNSNLEMEYCGLLLESSSMD